MLGIAGQGLPGFKVTAAGSLQPDPLAVRKLNELTPVFEAAGRLVGAALWHSKTFALPFARFFLRRALEMAQKERLIAYATDSAFAQASTAKASGLVLSRMNLKYPYTGTFPQHFAAKSSCCGQPVLVARVLPPPVFLSSKDADKSLPTLRWSCANVMLLGANTWSCSPGICFLPRWVMDNLGVLDGEQVEIEPLQPPINEEGHRVSRSCCAIRAREQGRSLEPGGGGGGGEGGGGGGGGAVDSRSFACDLVLSNDWWCGQRIRDVGGTSFVCAPNNVGEVGGGEAEIDWHDDRADLRHGVEGLQMRVGVR